jgi:predicted enzyme related to lactoylglutathione lyase
MKKIDSECPVGRIGEIVIDVHNLTLCGQFWSKVLGVQIKSEDERYLVLNAQPDGPGLILQKVTEQKRGKNRAHIDLRVRDIDRALSQVKTLGGRKVQLVEDPQERFIVVADPEGNEFCLIQEGK